MVSMALRVRKLGCLQPIYGFSISAPYVVLWRAVVMGPRLARQPRGLVLGREPSLAACLEWGWRVVWSRAASAYAFAGVGVTVVFS